MVRSAGEVWQVAHSEAPGPLGRRAACGTRNGAGSCVCRMAGWQVDGGAWAAAGCWSGDHPGRLGWSWGHQFRRGHGPSGPSLRCRVRTTARQPPSPPSQASVPQHASNQHQHQNNHTTVGPLPEQRWGALVWFFWVHPTWDSIARVVPPCLCRRARAAALELPCRLLRGMQDANFEGPGCMYASWENERWVVCQR